MGEFKGLENVGENVKKWLIRNMTGYGAEKIAEKAAEIKENWEQWKEENTIQEVPAVIAEDISPKEDYIDAAGKKDGPGEIGCNGDALVMCTNAGGNSEPLYIKKDEALIEICGKGRLNKLDIELDGHFTRCIQIGECCVDKDSIEDGMWKDANDLDDEGEGKNTLNEKDAYMICQAGGGVIYFQDATQKTREVVKDWETLYRYVNEEVFEKMGWDVEKFKEVYEEDAFEQLREYMYQYGVTNRYSVCMFIATLGEECRGGRDLEEDKDKNSDFSGLTYEYYTRGAGLIQITGFDQKIFLEFLKKRIEEDEDSSMEKSQLTDIETKLKGYPDVFPKKIIDGESKTNCTNTENVTNFIAENYPIESAVWYWASNNKCKYYTEYGSKSMPLNEYATKIGEKQGGDTFINLFLATQYYVNGGIWSQERLQKIAECTDDTYKIGDRLTFTLPKGDPDEGPHDGKLPNGWDARMEDWGILELELFG